MALSNCSTSVANTGEISCDVSRGVANKFFIFNGSIAAADYADAATLFAKLVELSKLSKSDSNKVFVLNEVQEFNRAREADKEGSLNLGYSAKLQEGRPKYTAKIFGGADLLKRLRTFNNQTVRLLEYDANGVLWGYKSGTNLKGFQAKLFFDGNELADGQNVQEGVIDVTISILSISEYKDNASAFSLSGLNIEDVVPLIDAQLAYVSHTSNALNYSLKIAGTNGYEDYDVLADYGTLIATLDANFSASSGATTAVGTSLAITSVAYSGGYLVVTYDSTAYSAVTSGHYIKLIPPTPAQLDAADMVNLEILSVTHVKPA